MLPPLRTTRSSSDSCSKSGRKEACGGMEGLEGTIPPQDRSIQGASTREPTYLATPLIVTANFGNFENAKVLVEVWPEGVQAVDRFEKTALHVAAEFGHFHILQLLLGQWPEGLYVKDMNGQTLMNYAACGVVISLGCNGTMLPPWKEVALSLECKHLDLLSKQDLELWLQCGGDLRLQPFGTPLLSHLKDEEAIQFWQERLESELSEKIVEDWGTWAALGAALVAAFAAVGLEQLYVKLWKAADQADRSPFQQGAHTLACKAFGGSVTLRKVWRLMEIFFVMIILGTCPLTLNWVSWYPLVAVLYVVPGIVVYGLKGVSSNPALILTTNNLANYVFGLLRLIALQILYRLVLDYQMSRWFDVAEYTQQIRPIDASYWLSWLVNPDFQTWVLQKPWGIWRESYLQDDFSWAPRWSADDIFQVLRDTFQVFPWLYGSCLLVAILHSFGRRHARTATLCCGDLGQSITRQAHEIQLAVQDLLQKEAEKFPEVNPKIKPVVGWAWPWQDAGIYSKVAFMLLDVALDINTVLAFFSEGNNGFAGIMAFTVARSILNQMRILRPWNLRKAIDASIARGIMRQDLLDFLMEEKRSEGLVAAWLTAWSIFLSVTASQMLLQTFSFLLSLYSVAGYLVQVCDWEINLHPEDTPKVTKDATTPSPMEDEDLVEI
ncbi:unnamed protein product [Symbiodinium sp. CCMP2592]|nr:unnamed protein product [Symbiodinium sp. CCMP2592]